MIKKLFNFFLIYLFLILYSCYNGHTSNIVDSTPETPVPKKLTLLVYMAADNDLETYAIQNLKQMEHSSFNNMNVLVLLDRAEGEDETNGNWTDTRLFEVQHDSTNSANIISKRISCPNLGLTEDEETELDMGNHLVLSSFIDFVKEKYSSDNYALIVWGHGTGWRYNSLPSRAVAIDNKSDTYISVKDLGVAVKNKEIDVIGFDTCFGGVFENIYEIENSCKYIVGSSNVTPSTGWNYKTLLENLSECNFEYSSIAKCMAESSAVKTSCYESAKLQNVMEKFESFSKNLSETITSTQSQQTVFSKLFNSESYSYSQYPCDMFLDVYKMADLYVNDSSTVLAQSAVELKTALNGCGSTTNCSYLQLGINFIPLQNASTIATQHSSEYLKNSNNTTQCTFIKDSNWWVPTLNGNSYSLLDKLFYKVY